MGRVEARGALFEALPFGHYEANRYVPALRRAAAWVESEVWGPNEAGSR